MDLERLELLLNAGENELIDYKSSISVSSPYQKAEFVKDVLALVNAHGSGPRYLIGGVDDDGKRLGSSKSLDDATMQQVVAAHIEPPVHFRSHYVADNSGLKYDIVEIEQSSKRFHLAARDVVENEKYHLHRGDIRIRRGSSTATLSWWDFERLRSDIATAYAREAEPLLKVGFLDGSDYLVVDKLFPSQAFGRPDCCEIPLRIMNDGAVLARELSIEITLNGGFNFMMTPRYLSMAARERMRVVMTGGRPELRVTDQGLAPQSPATVRGLFFSFYSEDGVYELIWKASAANMSEDVTGRLEVVIRQVIEPPPF